ncbi:MAG TPA: Holliday junction ATP-dependent DNA helicase RuvA [Ignavibacteria bacterium]|nr:Holliday junction ATP-dependent DNA helicase RuvA [Ignavibacteria bacterium]
MISSLRGRIIHRKNNEIVLDVNGVGYQVFISKKVSDKIQNLPVTSLADITQNKNPEITIITFLDVKENSLTLYGFIDEKEKEMYKLLISVNGIGPKMAHTILSNLSFEGIVSLISNKSFQSQIKIPGIGIKKLELISMTLKDKIYKIDKGIEISDTGEGENQTGDFIRLEALNALMNLGYLRNEGEKIIREVLKQNENSGQLTTEDIIRKSLEYISK